MNPRAAKKNKLAVGPWKMKRLQKVKNNDCKNGITF
jgi:hypothetical protein